MGVWCRRCEDTTTRCTACGGGRAVAPPSQVRTDILRAVVGGQWLPLHRYRLVYCVRWWNGSGHSTASQVRTGMLRAVVGGLWLPPHRCDLVYRVQWWEGSGSPLTGTASCTACGGGMAVRPPSHVRPGVLRTVAPPS